MVTYFPGKSSKNLTVPWKDSNERKDLEWHNAGKLLVKEGVSVN